MLGNILFVIVLIFFSGLANLLLSPKPGGDYGVGYSFVLLICGGGFIIFTALLVWNMNTNQRFEWLPDSLLRYRNWVIFLGWVTFITATFWSLEYHSKWNDGEFLPFMRWLALSKVYVWMPILVFLPCLYLINMKSMTSLPPAWVKTPFQVGMAVTFIIALGVFLALGKFWVQRRLDSFQSKLSWITEKRADYQAALNHIATYNDTTIAGLLKYVEPDNDRKLRDNAIAKIKTFKNWENDMIAILTQKDLENVFAYYDDTYYVYAFLDGNKVTHPEKFIEPIKYSLKVFAIRAERDLEDPYNRELGRLNLESVCQVLETQFKGYAKEFKPAMLKLQKVLALAYPERISDKHRKWYNKLVNSYRKAVQQWLEAN